MRKVKASRRKTQAMNAPQESATPGVNQRVNAEQHPHPNAKMEKGNASNRDAVLSDRNYRLAKEL